VQKVDKCFVLVREVTLCCEAHEMYEESGWKAGDGELFSRSTDVLAVGVMV
jgi:hypothetical protein